MVLLWLMWIAVICKTSQGDGITTTEQVLPHSEGVTNVTTAPSSKSLSTSTDSSKTIRDKRGTGQLIERLIKENDLTEDDEAIVQDKLKRSSRGTFIESPRVRFSSWAGKRAKFSSWGGKRADDELAMAGPVDYETAEEKRAKFSSWAGKRADEEGMNWVGNRPADLDNNYDQLEQKRAKFSSWAGKRDEDKRKFSSWAGKRFDDTLDINEITDDKRAKFSSWAGKRAKFNSWGGKRFNNNDNNNNNNNDGTEFDENIVEEKRRYIFPWKNGDENNGGKRAKFSSWGGKRGNDEWWGLKRARFNSWGGKRNINNINNTSELVDHEDALNKRSAAAYTPLSWKRKPIFSSWGGKRTARSTQPQRRLILPSNLFREHSSWGALLRPIRRGPDFYAWGGKRST